MLCFHVKIQNIYFQIIYTLKLYTRINYVNLEKLFNSISKFKIMSKQNNPLYPIDIEDYPKLFDYVLTKEGLLYFHSLKRSYLLGKDLSQDEYNKIRLLYVYYATANRNIENVFLWQDICVTLDKKGIIEKNMFQSKESLKDNHLIVENPRYQSGLYRKYTEYVKNHFQNK